MANLQIKFTDAERQKKPEELEGDAEVVEALANLIIDEFADLNDSEGNEHIVSVYRRKLAELRALRNANCVDAPLIFIDRSERSH